MQAIIMAAGKGVRMLPLTQATPKSLLKVNGRAIIDYTIEALPEQVDEIIILVGYLGNQIREHITSFYPDRRIIFVEVEPLGTGYAVWMCKPYIKGAFIVLNGDDIYKKEDIGKIVNDEIALLAKDVSNEPDFPEAYTRFDKVIRDQNENFVSLEKAQQEKENFIVIGVYKLTPNFFNYDLVRIANGELGLPQTIFKMAADHKIRIAGADFWLPIGYPQDIQKAEERLKQ